ncbi:MAG: hypothetical protein IT357_02105 [Gemmatimonadaceae bacterium]|nr:hypothetical protein [Gemmatimonadaceae bacterium]
MPARRGSQKWIQVAVNERPEVLRRALQAAGAVAPRATISWVSPLADRYAEYRDEAFLQKLGLELKARPLSSFWPARGPVWDGLARTSDDEYVLVEAKAHIAEMVSPASKASPASLAKIERALKETRDALAPKTTISWSGTFYQITNRLAHLYLLRTLNRINARLVFLYFVGDEDVGGPVSRAEWDGAIRVTEAYLGVGRHRLSSFVHHAFIDVKELGA